MAFSKKLTVSARLTLGFGAICLFLIALGSFALVTMGKVQDQTERIIENWMPSVSKAYQIKLKANETYRQLGELATLYSEALEDDTAEKNATLKLLVEAYVAETRSAEGKEAASRFLVDYEGGEANYRNIVDQAKAGNTIGALLLYDSVATRLHEDVGASLDELIRISEAEAAKAGEANGRQYDRGYRIIVAAMGSIALLSVLLSIWTARSILSPIRKINTILKDLAGATGDLSRRIRIRTGDEIERMADNVNRVLETVENMVIHIRASTAEVASSSVRIEESCSLLSSSTEEISGAVTGLSEKSTVQAETTQSSRQLVHDYLDKLERMAEKAQQTHELALHAQEATERGGGQMDAILSQMQIITKHNDTANASLENFRSKLEHVEKVNELIRSISEQTTILSLNAGIEAARAGVHGKGFAVIAGEVRKLSSGTKESAQSIVSLLDEIKLEVEGLTEQFLENTRNIKAGSEQIRRLTNTFRLIEETNGTVMENGAATKEEADRMLFTASEIVRVFEMIGAASEEQSAASQQISASVEEQLGSTQLIEAYTKELAGQSDRLKRLVEQFHVSV